MVTVGILAVIIALCAIVRSASEGTFAALAEGSASHAIQSDSELDVFLDVLLF
jgi:hypothetical protein